MGKSENLSLPSTIHDAVKVRSLVFRKKKKEKKENSTDERIQVEILSATRRRRQALTLPRFCSITDFSSKKNEITMRYIVSRSMFNTARGNSLFTPVVSLSFLFVAFHMLVCASFHWSSIHKLRSL